VPTAGQERPQSVGRAFDGPIGGNEAYHAGVARALIGHSGCGARTCCLFSPTNSAVTVPGQ